MSLVIEDLKLTEIYSSLRMIRDHINTHRYQVLFLADHDAWGQLCSSLDILDDTIYGISSYVESDFPKEVGLKYLHLFGLLQLVFVQQDAIKTLREVFGLPFEFNNSLKEIRKLRNASIGHPTKQTNDRSLGPRTFFNHISRHSMEKFGFQISRYSKGIEPIFEQVKLKEIILTQTDELKFGLEGVIEEIQNQEEILKKKYKGKILSEILNRNVSYAREKTYSGIGVKDVEKVRFAASLLCGLKESYEELVRCIKERNEWHSFFDQDSDDLFNAMSHLSNFYSGTSSFNQSDARIFHEFIFKKIEDMQKFAKEIDEFYQA